MGLNQGGSTQQRQGSWRAWLLPVGLTLAAVAVALAGNDGREWLRYDRSAIADGEIWRLVTPAFVHLDWLHIVFNMYWTFVFGSLIEDRRGTLKLGLMVLAIAVISNIVQAAFEHPNFGGMSGVVYGLFGYAWTRGRLEPTSGLYLRSDIAFWMMGWFVLCAIGAIPNVANWAHGVGLVCGVVIGYLPLLLRPAR